MHIPSYYLIELFPLSIIVGAIYKHFKKDGCELIDNENPEESDNNED